MAARSTIFGPSKSFDVSRRTAMLLPIAAGVAMQGESARASGENDVPITYVAQLRARPGMGDALRAVLSERQPLQHGCLYFSTAQDTKDRDVFWTIEVWKDEASHAAAIATPVMQSIIARSQPLLAGYEPIAAADVLTMAQARRPGEPQPFRH